MVGGFPASESFACCGEQAALFARAMAEPALENDRALIAPETPADADGVEALVMAAFGPGRFAKTAERLREGGTVATGFVTHEEGRVVGSVRLWRIMVGATPALFLGPIAVERSYRKGGLGAALVDACLEFAAAQGQGVLLVGDPPYFEKFGFVAAPGARLPGPVDQRRVLWRGGDAPSGAVTRG